MATDLFTINPALDRAALARRFAADGRVQIRDVLEIGAARALREVVATRTPWGAGWQAGEDGPHALRADEAARLPPAERAAVAGRINRAMRAGDYAFSYARYPMVDAYLNGWDAGGPHDIVLEHINSEPCLDLVRTVTAMPELHKADAQATLFAPGHFLARHVDAHAAEGWRIAYVLSLCGDDWRPDWGGYLLFFDEDGDVSAGFRPRFNTLSLFAVPTPHSVSYVPPFAPAERVSLTGWFRDR